MDSPKNMVILDNVGSIRSRIKSLVENMDINVYEASNPRDVLNTLSEIDYKAGLVIMEINYAEDSGFAVLKKIKEKNRDIPVIILTSDSRRLTFVRGIVEGASDYVLKPFEDKMVLDRIMRYLGCEIKEKTAGEEVERVSLSLHGYVNGEFKKSVKGKYHVTVAFSTFFKPVKEITKEQEKEYVYLSEIIYNSLKEIIWETDILERYGSQALLGIFPFCGKDNHKLLAEKFSEKFSQIKRENKQLAGYYLVNSFITYPGDCETIEEAFNKLSMDIKRQIDTIKDENRA